MIKLILALTLALSFTAQSESRINTCKEIEMGARAIMQMRQLGKPMSYMLDIMKDSEMGVKLVIKAYEKPRYSIEPYMSDSISSFANKAMLECMKIEVAGDK